MTTIKASCLLIDQTIENLGYSLWVKSREFLLTEKDGQTYLGQDKLDQEYINKINRMGLQYANADFRLLEIQGPMFLRDLLYSVDGFAKWATSTRLQYSTEMERSDYKIDEASSDFSMEEFDEWMTHVDAGEDTDLHRAYMPMSASSKFWVGGSLRDFRDIVSYMKLRLPFMYESYGKLIQEELGFDLIPYVSDIMGDLELGSFGSLLSQMEVGDHAELGNVMLIRNSFQNVLFSQWIRQSPARIAGYSDFLRATVEKMEMPIGKTPVDTVTVITRNKLERTLKTRSCWFSMSDHEGSWKDLLDVAVDGMNLDEFAAFLPCSGCADKCKHAEDIKFRAEGIEKGGALPCPILEGDIKFALKREEKSSTKTNKLYVELMRGRC